MTELFDAVTALHHEARPGFLEKACGADTRVLEELRRLLESSASPVPAGERFAGPYRLVSQLGQGGMGAVYPRQLRRLLTGDLDSVLLKALRKEPEWRYATAGDLTEDIRRHLAGQRIAARKDTLRYRAERLAHRILYPEDAVFHSHGILMATAGLLATWLLLERQSIEWRWKESASTGIDALVVALWLGWAVFEGRRMARVGKSSALDRQSWLVFTLIAIALGTLTIAAVVNHSIPPRALAVFWNAGLSVGLLAIGIQANRMMTAGGIALLVSALAAAIVADWAFIFLAAGMLGGMVIPGLLLTIRGRRRK